MLQSFRIAMKLYFQDDCDALLRYFDISSIGCKFYCGVVGFKGVD